ncbi:MAG: DUF2382 domain-containing protein [Thermomicrobiales bacterium]
MSQEQTWNIVGGSEVVGSDGEKLGTVDRVQGQYVVAKKGWFFPTDYYIPTDAIASVSDDVVSLNVPKETVLNQGWDSTPADLENSEYRDAGSYDDNSAVTGTTAGLDDIGRATPVAGEYVDNTTRAEGNVDSDELIRVPLTEEELTATRREVDRGEVRVEKDVVAEERTLEVPVTEERVNVTRRVVDRDTEVGDAAFEEGTIEIPVRGEEVDLQKQTRVREELEISKEAVDRTEKVSGTVRHEEARVTDTTKSVNPDADKNNR